MSLDELAELLNHQQAKFPRPFDLLARWPRAAGALILLDEQTRATLPATIREFATKQIWPERLSDDAQAMLGFRLDWAWHLVQTLRAGECGAALYPAAGWSAAAALEWCLVEAWEWPGYCHWQAVAEALDGKGGPAAPAAVDLN